MKWVLLAVLVIGGPALFTRDGFSDDFTNHLWLVWVQERAISQHLGPTYFVNAAGLGVFYPFFVFYGGTLYAATGALGALLAGHVEVAYVGVALLSIAAAYGGLLWLARQLGVRSWMAHAPSITFVASAYYVTNLYGRGAWPEFVATSTIPLLVASSCKLARSPRIEPWPAALFVVTTIFAAGSHNPTLLVGGILAVGGVVLIWPALAIKPVPHNPRRIIEIGALAALGIAVDGWFLLPDLLHASDTQVGGVAPLYPWSATSFLNTPGILFDPLRAVPPQSTTPALFVQIPDWLLAWALVAIASLWAGAERRLKRVFCAGALLLAAVLALMMVGPLWDAMPRALREIQFPYRLDTDVALCVSGLVLVSVIALERAGLGRRQRELRSALLGAGAVTIALCVWQLWVPTTHVAMSYSDRGQALVSTHVLPRTWYDRGAYFDASQPLVPVARAIMSIDPARINSDHVNLRVTPPAGPLPFATNIAGGPYVVRLSGGLSRAGDMPSGLAAVKRVDGAGKGPVTITLSPATGAMTVGRDVTIGAILILSLLLGLAIRNRWRLSAGEAAGG